MELPLSKNLFGKWGMFFNQMDSFNWKKMFISKGSAAFHILNFSHD